MGYFMEQTNDQPTGMNVMVDCETLGVKPGAPIITIGAVLFDPLKESTADQLRAQGRMWRIDVEDAIKQSEGVDGGTIKWWLGQDPKALRELTEGSTVTLKAALMGYVAFCTIRDPMHLPAQDHHLSLLPRASLFWAKSPDFDGKILEYAFDRLGIPNPYRFFQYRCVRTIQDLAWPDGPDARPRFNVGTAHSALDDAIEQAMLVQAGYRQLGLAT
jgi:exodeoxyribonuclease VIII